MQEGANIKLSGTITDINGKSVRDILDTILSGTEIDSSKYDELDAHIKHLDDDIDNQMKQDEKQAVDAIRPVTGLGTKSAQAILAVIGTDMGRFPTDAHISSWAGSCLGDNESVKKRKSGKTRKGNRLLRSTLVVCARSAAKVKNYYFHAQFQRVSVHRNS